MKRGVCVLLPLIVLSSGCIEVGHPAEVGCLADMSEPGCQTPGTAGGVDAGPGNAGNGAKPPGQAGTAGAAGARSTAGAAGAAGEERGGFAGNGGTGGADG